MKNQSDRYYKIRFLLSLIIFVISSIALANKLSAVQGPSQSPPPLQPDPIEPKISQTPSDQAEIQEASTTSENSSSLADFEKLLKMGVLPSTWCFQTLSNRLNAAAIQLTGLDDQQVQFINAALIAANNEILDLQKKYSQSEVKEDGSLEIKCSAFPEEGAEIREALIAEISKMLPPEQCLLFRQLSEDWNQLSTPMRAFGATPLTYKFSIREDHDDIGYDITREPEDWSKLGSASWSLNSRAFTKENLAGTEYGYLLAPEHLESLQKLRDDVEREIRGSEEQDALTAPKN